MPHIKPLKARRRWDRRRILADHISGTAVLEYGPTEILPQVGANWKALRVSADRVAKPAAHTRAESRGSRPSTADAAERLTLCWREQDSNHRSRGDAPDASRAGSLARRLFRSAGIKPRRHSKIGRVTRDRWFESGFLQR